MLRPALSHLLENGTKNSNDSDSKPLSPLFRQILIQCAVACVRTAQQAIHLVHRERSRIGEVGAVDAWWFNIMCLFSCATCLVAARLLEQILIDVSPNEIVASWLECLEILEEYATFNTTVRRVINALRVLHAALPLRQTVAAKLAEGDRAPIAVDLTANAQASGTTGMKATNINGSTIGWFSDDAGFDLQDFDFNFDPDDVSWLTAVPMDFQ